MTSAESARSGDADARDNKQIERGGVLRLYAKAFLSFAYQPFYFLSDDERMFDEEAFSNKDDSKEDYFYEEEEEAEDQEEEDLHDEDEG